MLERGHTLRFVNSFPWKEFLGLSFISPAKVAGLGVRINALKTGNADVARDMAKGIFSFSGKTIAAKPVAIFDREPPTPEWSLSLHNLTWLAHFIASGNELHRIIARTLILKWADCTTLKRSGLVNAEALISLSLAANFLVGNSSAFDKPLFTIIGHLTHRVSAQRTKNPLDRLQQAVALLHASLAFRFNPSMREDANARFCDVINQVILPDGGHITRDPLKLVDMLLTLVPVRNAMLESHQAVPQPLASAIERMVPMLRMLCHGDHELSHFQGAGSPRINWIKAVLDRDKVHGRPLLLAPHSGYCRLAHRSGLLLVDVGASARCQSPLALEFSDGQHRIFSNCGMPLVATAAWQNAASGIAAHNTLEVDGLMPHARNAPCAEVITSPKGSLAKCQNRLTNTVTHERNLFLSHDGRDLRGEDLLSSGQPCTIRFHLHPAVKASSIRNGFKIVVMLPNRAVWQFSAKGGFVSLEESVFLGDETGPRKSMQIVIRAAGAVKWSLRKLDRSGTNGNGLEESLELPF
jgi:uncharacterized heparinase superfamily protein